MTDLDKAAAEYWENIMGHMLPHGEDEWFTPGQLEDAFKAGHAHAMQSREVLALFNALGKNDRGCDFTLIQREIDGVTLQGTKHSDKCSRCSALAAFELLRKGTPLRKAQEGK